LRGGGGEAEARDRGRGGRTRDEERYDRMTGGGERGWPREERRERRAIEIRRLTESKQKEGGQRAEGTRGKGWGDLEGSVAIVRIDEPMQ
jgi:hypothetical protein